MIQRYSRPGDAGDLERTTQARDLAADRTARQRSALRDRAGARKGFRADESRARPSPSSAASELERTLNHDVIAFTTNVAENIGAPASRWLHFGLTSSDVVDTAFAVQMVQIGRHPHRGRQGAAQGRSPPRRKEHQFTPMIGRSHGIHAEPTTFGLKLALMYDEFGRALRAARSRAREAVAVGKLSGAVGTSAHLSPRDRGVRLQASSACAPRRSPRRWCSATSTPSS